MELNKITGAQFFDARTSIGLSISSVAKFTGLNRNVLSQFEKEKTSLSVSDKKKLIEFYTERGYDFEAELIDGEYHITKEDLDHFESNVEKSKQSLEEATPDKVLICMRALIDEMSDYIYASNHYVPEQAEKVEQSSITLNDTIEDTPENHHIADDYKALNARLIELFSLDKDGENANKVGLFSESGTNRNNKLVTLLAYQQLRLIKMQHPELVGLSLSEELGSDNQRMLEVFTEVLDFNSLGEFKDITKELVA